MVGYEAEVDGTFIQWSLLEMLLLFLPWLKQVELMKEMEIQHGTTSWSLDRAERYRMAETS